MVYITLWSWFIALGNFHFGYVLNEIDQIWDITPWIYGFAPEDRHSFNNYATQITTLFAAVTTLLTWIPAKMGKRRLLMVNWGLVIIATAIRMIASYITLMIGRALLGIAIGMFSWIIPLFICEISPLKHTGPLIGITQQFIALGLLWWFSMGTAIPILEKYDSETYWKPLEGVSVPWRYLFLLPGVIAIIQLAALLFYFTKENPGYLKTAEDEVSQSYFDLDEHNSRASSINAPADFIEAKAESRIEEEDTYRNLWALRNRRALMIGCMVHIFQQTTGINMVLEYSFYFPLTEGTNQVNLRFLMGIIGFVVTPMSLYFMRIYKRKPLFLIGFLVIWACNTLLFQTFDEDGITKEIQLGSFISVVSLLSITTFVVVFSLTIGTLAWVYSAEILTEKGMGIAICWHWVSNFFIFLLPDISLSFSHHGETDGYFDKDTAVFFFLFSGTSMIAFFFTIVFLKETKDKSKAKIKASYDSRLFDTLRKY